jgi:DNA-binding PadR family transcriptional regulator
LRTTSISVLSRDQQVEKLKQLIGPLYGTLSLFSGGRAATIAVNYAILERLAIEGPANAFQLQSKLKTHPAVRGISRPNYTTIDLRLKDLKKMGYISSKIETHAVGKKETFDLSLKGLLVTASFPKLKRKLIQVFLREAEVEIPELFAAMKDLPDWFRDYQDVAQSYIMSVSAWIILNRRDFENLTERRIESLFGKAMKRALIRLYSLLLDIPVEKDSTTDAEFDSDLDLEKLKKSHEKVVSILHSVPYTQKYLVELVKELRSKRDAIDLLLKALGSGKPRT